MPDSWDSPEGQTRSWWDELTALLEKLSKPIAERLGGERHEIKWLIETMIAEAVAAEREAVAKFAELAGDPELAAAIRARGEGE